MKIYKNNYVYLIMNIYDYFPKKYIGTRSTDLQPEDDLGKIYFSSSSEEQFMQEQETHPERFEYYVLDNFETRQQALQLEIELHDKNDVAKNPMFYNKSKQTSVGFDTTGMRYKKTKEQCIAQSIAFTGRKFTKSHKKSLSIQRKNTLTVRDKNGRMFRINKNDQRWINGEVESITTGRKNTEEYKKNMSKVTKGTATYRYKNGECKHLSINHPDVLSGKAKNVSFGKKWIRKNGVEKKIPKEDVEKFLEKGWEFGRCCKSKK